MVWLSGGGRKGAALEGGKPVTRLHFLTRVQRRRVGAGLAVLGLTLWITAAGLRVTPADATDVSFPHFEARLLAVITGGAAVAGGIILAAAG